MVIRGVVVCDARSTQTASRSNFYDRNAVIRRNSYDVRSENRYDVSAGVNMERLNEGRRGPPDCNSR